MSVRKNGSRIDPDSLGEVESLCRKDSIDVVIGADYDTAVLLASSASKSLLPVCSVAAQSTLETFNDKWNFTRLLEELKLPFPDSQYISNEIQLCNTSLEFPIITKPLDLWASVGFQIHRSRAELTETLRLGRLSARFPLIAQSFVPGIDAGASFLASHGRLVAYSVFHHRRQGSREFLHDPRVRAYLEEFVTATDYVGVGHIDMRFNLSTNEYKILELNPRFWASLLYATHGGLNYPDLLVRLPELTGAAVKTLPAREVSLPMYERAMTVLNRWCGQGYEGLCRPSL